MADPTEHGEDFSSDAGASELPTEISDFDAACSTIASCGRALPLWVQDLRDAKTEDERADVFERIDRATYWLRESVADLKAALTDGLTQDKAPDDAPGAGTATEGMASNTPGLKTP